MSDGNMQCNASLDDIDNSLIMEEREVPPATSGDGSTKSTSRDNNRRVIQESGSLDMKLKMLNTNAAEKKRSPMANISNYFTPSSLARDSDAKVVFPVSFTLVETRENKTKAILQQANLLYLTFSLDPDHFGGRLVLARDFRMREEYLIIDT